MFGARTDHVTQTNPRVPAEEARMILSSSSPDFTQTLDRYKPAARSERSVTMAPMPPRVRFTREPPDGLSANPRANQAIADATRSKAISRVRRDRVLTTPRFCGGWATVSERDSSVEEEDVSTRERFGPGARA